MVMRYMLDTDICIALIKNRPETMLHRLKGLSFTFTGPARPAGADVDRPAAEGCAPLRSVPFVSRGGIRC